MATDEHAVLPLTVFIAVRNEAVNLPRCLAALKPAARVVVLDSRSTDATVEIATSLGAETVQFDYAGGYPKKRQWALDTVHVSTPWILLLDADEVVTDDLWREIRGALAGPETADAFLIRKGFHFLGRRFRFGGFSHEAVLLFRAGRARFERLTASDTSGLDMEVHERVVVDGRIARLREPLIHEDFKGLEAYIARHNQYSTWEAAVRRQFLESGLYGEDTIRPRAFGNAQERRRYLKSIVVRLPFEPQLWFAYHYILRLGFLEGRPGLIACQIRASYISQTRAKLFEAEQLARNRCAR